MSHSLRPLVIAVGLALAFPALAAKPAAKPAPKQEAAPTATAAEFELAHNLSADGEKSLQAFVDRFNKETGSNLKLVRLEKGDKPAGLNLVRRQEMSEVLSQAKYFVPLHEMMAKAGVKLDTSGLSTDLKANVVDAKGRLVALPVLYSTPVLFYNKNAFRKARLDPDQPPKTWFEMQGMLDKLQDAGYACPYTTAWPVWVHVDNVSAVSGLPATDKGQLAFNGLPQVKHVAMMATWTKANYFKLFGRGDEASKKFHAGECAMITTDSREHIDFRDARGVELGVAPMPFHDDVYGGRRPSLADGASLWVGAGRSPAEYKQAAKFVSFLLAPDNQIELVRSYGGLPMTAAARAAARSKLLQDGDQALQAAYASLKGASDTPMVHVSDIDPLRVIANEELELAWSDKEPSKAALDKAVGRGNAVLAAKPALKKAQPF
ncbi:extracellular solute-binding protein [Dechloromonas sp. H13]|uniref:extracellular solute-binding protein n=1 Tax=Dechloromonas sp. H13 TaxID=2570193 RepID=UPI0012919FFE|nr:extracellular solute-binding protein [Dechloromonas sp. H13]